LSIKKFQYFLDNFTVFRAKGICGLMKVLGVIFSREAPSIEDEDWKGERKNQLVLIGQDLDHEKLRSQLQSCVSSFQQSGRLGK